jgi:valyl-tRNA synthetase
MNVVQNLIAEIRAFRKEIDVEEKAVVRIELRVDSELQADVDAEFELIFKRNSAIIERLARVKEVSNSFVKEITAGLAKHSAPGFPPSASV